MSLDTNLLSAAQSLAGVSAYNLMVPRLALNLQRDVLGMKAIKVETTLTEVAKAILRQWQGQVIGLADATLSQADVFALCDALVPAITAAVWGPLKTGAASGNLTTIRDADGSQRQYAAYQSDPRDDWQSEAMRLFALVPAVRLLRHAQVRPVQLFGNVAPRRHSPAALSWGYGCFAETDPLLLEGAVIALCGVELC